MPRRDPEITQLRESVHCAAILEHQSPPWRVDRKESTKHCLKYRRGNGEILILNHEGRGWWDPQSDAKGDIFDLIQHLDSRLNFGHARKLLRAFAGVRPTYPAANRSRRDKTSPAIPIAQRWAQRPRLKRGSPVWHYLTAVRHLPANVLETARTVDILRDGPHGSGWFAHRDDTGRVTHVEIRGPIYKGSLRGGTKVLFRFHGGSAPPIRFVLAEAPIDALSLAAIEGVRADTLYAATGGGMGPPTIATIARVLADMASNPAAMFCSATDANPAGAHYALRHQELAARAGVAFERLKPPIEGGDWNDVLKQQSQQRVTP